MPDIYIPMDTIALTPFYKEVVEKDLISKFVYNKLISSPPSFAVENFIEDYHLSSANFKEFLEFLKSQGVNYSTQEVNLSSKQLEVDIKALMGRYFFGNEAWFKVRNHDDYIIQRSLEVLN